MVNVVMMGYTRQGTALGLGMLALASLLRARQWQFIFWALAATTFHKTAVILLPLAVLGRSRNRWSIILGVGVVAGVAFWVFLYEQLGAFYANYIQAEYRSAGALVRLTMNAIPAAILLIWGRRFTLLYNEQRIWWWIALVAITLLLIYPIVPSSTALDRLGLFLIPLQLVIFSHLPDAIGRTGKNNPDWVFIILIYCVAVQFVWLNFASHAYLWLPYQFYPFVSP
jgi:hypothetical protein